MIGDHGSGDDVLDGPSDGRGEGPPSRVAVVTVWREQNSNGPIRGRLLSEVGTERFGPPVVEYAEGVDAIGDLVKRWLVRFASNSKAT